jgi:hypothetical protein
MRDNIRLIIGEKLFVPRQQKHKAKHIVGLVGIGLDNSDGHRRITRSEHFLLMGGSAETHERMQDTAIRFEEELKRRGKRIQETTVEESLELLRKAHRA